MPRVTAVDPNDDIGALARTVATGINRRVHERLFAAGFGNVRTAHRDIMLGLQAGDTTVVELAGRLGVSAQAVSKAVTELELNRFVERGRDPGDGRVRPLSVTARGEALVDALRRARTSEMRDLARWLGTRDHGELVRLLQHAAEHVRGVPPS